MANVQMAIGLRRKTCDNFVMFSGLEIMPDNITYKIAYRWGLVFIQWISLLTVLFIYDG